MKQDLFEFQKNSFLGKVSGEPLCQEYKQLWKGCGNDKEMLMKLAMRQQAIPYVVSACHKKLGLSKDYIKEQFGDYINGYTLRDCDGTAGYTYGMYVDWDYENDLEITTDVASIMWTVGANMVIPETKCPVLYISNRSKVHLICEGYNTVNVKLFDESELVIEDMDAESDIVVYKYSDKAKVEQGKYCLKEPKIFNKELRL